MHGMETDHPVKMEKTDHKNSPGGSGLTLSKNALEVLKARYLKRDDDGVLMETPEALFRRVAREVASIESRYGLSTVGQEEVEEEFYDLMATQKFMPNSPTLMNAGRRMGMLSACFVLPVEDSIDGIFSSIKHTALIQKAGGGTGFSFSRLRPSGDIVRSSGGRTSGPLSFLKVFSKATDAIQQGAFRRGANMGIMRVDHPDIVSFIRIKEDTSKLTNFNLSVGMTDSFMKGLTEDPESPHIVVNPRTGERTELIGDDDKPWSRQAIFELIVDKAWANGEPGLVFLDRINQDNPTPHIGEIEATNPCGEQPLLPYESCNLGSINLGQFVKETDKGPEFDFAALKPVIHLSVRFLDNIIDLNKYPLPEIENMTRANRKVGLGIMGFADVLFRLGIPYNSDEGLKMGESLMEYVQEESHAASEALAAQRGVFPNWRGSMWEKIGRPMRNAATTTVAPTGTISIISDCSGGIEPLFSLAFFRNVLNGKRLAEVNQYFLKVAEERGCLRKGLVEELAEKATLHGIKDIPDDIKRVFVTAHDIEPEWHVRMQAAFQNHCDSSISKTINFPREAEKSEVSDIYQLAFAERVKGITVYRDGARDLQPMATAEKKEEKSEAEEPVAAEAPAEAPKPKTKKELKAEEREEKKRLVPIKLPEIMSSLRIRQVTPFGNMHIKITIDAKTGIEREIFAQLGRGGDIANSDLEAICRLTSLFLRCGGDIEDVEEQLNGIGSSLSVPSKDGRIMSLADGLAKGMQKYFFLKKKYGLERLLLGDFELHPMNENLTDNSKKTQNKALKGFTIKCPECANDLTFAEGCAMCHNCGFSKC